MRIIKLTESDLEQIIKKVISEQVPGMSGINYQAQAEREAKLGVQTAKMLPCVPTAFKLSVQQLIQKNYNKLFLKVCLGIIGRESDFGESNRFKFRNPLKTLYGALGGNASVGFAQVQPETAKQYGLELSDLLMASGSLDITYRLLQDNYNKAIKVGYTTGPSMNLKDGTGNSALDMAISAHNLGAQKITKYCKTSNPKINRPCDLAGKTTSEGLKVSNQYVQNYIPNFKTERWDGVEITSHGYIIEVAKRIKEYTCF
jgi:hypothetical protein